MSRDWLIRTSGVPAIGCSAMTSSHVGARNLPEIQALCLEGMENRPPNWHLTFVTEGADLLLRGQNATNPIPRTTVRFFGIDIVPLAKSGSWDALLGCGGSQASIAFQINYRDVSAGPPSQAECQAGTALVTTGAIIIMNVSLTSCCKAFPSESFSCGQTYSFLVANPIVFYTNTNGNGTFG